MVRTLASEVEMRKKGGGGGRAGSNDATVVTSREQGGSGGGNEDEGSLRRRGEILNRDGVGGGRREDLKTEGFQFPTEHTLFSQSTSKYKVLLQSPFHNLYDIHLLHSNIITQDCLDAAKKTEKCRKKMKGKFASRICPKK